MIITLTGSASSLTFDESDIVSSNGVRATKTHTGISDFQITLRGERDVEPFAARQDQILISVESGTEFIGYITDASHNIRAGTTSISGYGIAKRLEETRPDYESLGGSLTYSNISVQEALRDYWARTEFSNYTVYDQPLETVAENELVQSADTQTEWESLTDIAADYPARITTTGLESTKVAYTREGNETDAESGTPQGLSGTVYSGGIAQTIADTGDTLEYKFTPEHDIPDGKFALWVRDDDGGAGDGSDGACAFEWRFDGELVDELTTTGVGLTLGWSKLTDGVYDIAGSYDAPALTAGETYTISVECTDGGALGDQYSVDVLAPVDQRYESQLTFDNDNGGNDGFLDGPEFYPNDLDVETVASPVSFNVASSDVDATINDTTSNQAISVSNDGGTNYTQFNNTTTVSHSYSGAGREVRTRFTLSRFGSRTTATPQTGFNNQIVDSFTHRIDGNNLAVLVDLELSKNHFDNLQTLHNKGDFVWNIEHDDKPIDELVVESFKRGDQTKTLPVQDEIDSNPEIAGENYYNSIYLQGALVNGSRPTAEAKNEDEIDEDRGEISPGVLRDLDITTEGGAIYRANVLLTKASENNALRGTKTYPADFSIQPGYAYGTDFGSGPQEFALEELALRYNGNEATVTLDFIPRRSIAEDISELKRNSRQQSDRV